MQCKNYSIFSIRRFVARLSRASMKLSKHLRYATTSRQLLRRLKLTNPLEYVWRAWPVMTVTWKEVQEETTGPWHIRHPAQTRYEIHQSFTLYWCHASWVLWLISGYVLKILTSLISPFFYLLALLFSQNSCYFYIFTVSFIFFSKLNFKCFQTERSETVDSLQNVTKFGIIVSSFETPHPPKKAVFKTFLYKYFNHW